MKMHLYKVVVQFPKAKCWDTILLEASGIRWAIENAAKQIQIKHSCMKEKADFEIMSVEKV